MQPVDRKSILPPFGRIALAGFAVNAPFIALFLILANVKMAVSLVAGYGLALSIYGLLHVIISHGLDVIAGVQSDAGSGSRGKSLSTMTFVMLMMGKYVLVGALLFVVWRTGYIEVWPFIGGFLLAQIAITWMSVTESKKTLFGQ